MAESYVVNGAKVSCSMGEIESPLRTTPGRNVKLRGKDRANTADCVPLVNVGPFGLCKTTGMPCAPACTVWLNGKNDVLVNGMPALLDKSTAVCPLGAGILKIEDDGQ
ncbi:MAG: DUF4280 domain-containing protein [Lachnospiraceae bacterium]|nr:DUF4280 domain-containing protein [Lachnospiraceae bacterium]